MACEVTSMNSFRSAILSGKGLHSTDPLVRAKNGRGAETDSLSSVEVPRSEHRSHNHRDDDRHRLDHETASVLYKGKTRPVDLINLSGGGAMIRADFGPRLWDRIDLMLGEGAAIECAVRWIREDRIGLEFAHETRIDCDPEVRDALLLDVIRRSFPDVVVTSAPAQLPTEAKKDSDDSVVNSRRTERRHPLIWMAHILYNHGSERVRLRNISENGALIESPVSYPEGAQVLLDLGEGGQHFARVGWSCGDKVGLAFDKSFDLTALVSVKPEVAHDQWTRPGPGQISADHDNPWAEGWQRSSLEDLREDLEGFLKR
jgi:hypothetical protein